MRGNQLPSAGLAHQKRPDSIGFPAVIDCDVGDTSLDAGSKQMQLDSCLAVCFAVALDQI